MKRDWDLLRQLLINVEDERTLFDGLDDGDELLPPDEQRRKADILLGHLELLTNNGYIEGAEVVRALSGFAGYSAGNPRLSMAGHDLLDTMRSATLWENIKTTAKKKGVELSFDAIKVLGATALKHLPSRSALQLKHLQYPQNHQRRLQHRNLLFYQHDVVGYCANHILGNSLIFLNYK